MDDVTYSCTGCRRAFRAPRSRVLELLATRRVRCQVCGAPLEFPDDVRAEFDVLSKTPAGSRVVREVEVDCPVCARVLRSDPDLPERVVSCRYCGATMRLPLEGSVARCPPLEGPPASLDDVKRGLLYLPHDALGEIAGHALTTRAARGEVASGEVEMLVRALAALARWRPEDHPDAFLPLSQEQAAVTVPVLLFGGTLASRDDRSGVLELVFSIGILTEPSETARARLAVNIIGTVTLLAAGAGIFMQPRLGDTEDVQHLLRVSITPSGEGVILGLSHQLDDALPRRGGDFEHAGLRESVIAAAPRFAEYYALIAIYGAWAQGKTIMQASPRAIERRLVALGEPLASRAAEIATRLKPAATSPA